MTNANEAMSGLQALVTRQVETQGRERRQSARLAIDTAVRQAVDGVGAMTPEAQAQFEKQRYEDDRSRIIVAARLPPSHLRLDQAEGERWREAFDRACAIILKPSRVGATIAMIGPNGTGKTQAAVAIAVWLADNLMPSKYVKADDLFDELHDARNTDGVAVRSVIHRWSAPTLLIIDEIDKRGESWYEDRTICRIIDNRYVAARHTILLGNYSEEGFDKQMDRSITSRIEERGAVIVCNWPSFRAAHSR